MILPSVAKLARTAAARTAFVFAAFVVLALSSASPAMAASAKNTPPVALPSFPAEFATPIAEWNTTLDRLEGTLNEKSVSDSALDAARITLEAQAGQISHLLKEWRPREESARAQFDKLGAPPAAGQPPEPEALAQQRTETGKTLNELSAAVRTADAGLSRTNALANRAREMRRIQFELRTLRRADSPFSPALWQDVATNAPDGIRQLGAVLTDWWNRITDKPQFMLLLTAALVCWGILTYLAGQGVRYFRRWQDTEPPSEWRRGASAGWVILLRALPATAAVTGLYYALASVGVLPPPAMDVVQAMAIALVIVAVVRAVARTVLAIRRPQWRLLELSNQGAVTLYYHLLALAIVYATDFVVTTLSRAASMPFSLNDAQSAAASISIAAIIISILRIRVRSGEGDSDAPHIGPHYVRTPLWLIALAILGAAAAGYIPLARFIAGQLIVTSTVIIIAYLLRFWASAFGQSLADDGSVAGRWLRDHAGLAQQRRDALVLPITLLLKAIIIISAVPFIMLLWGFDVHDIRRWVEIALFGFDFGTTRLSITLVVGALVVFVAAYVAAGIFRVWLDRHVLEPAGVEGGVRDSVRAGVGYLGFGAAAIAAISYAGFDFSNLAIVAGALSLGLGFGMQSIVNNFVSGLILLAERPIKVGDWIVVGSDEGIVHSISVRATVIETFDRSNIIIPNSQLISQTVQNWTLQNNTGRIKIPVGVHYDSDPEQVRSILLEIAQQNPQVLSEPEPFVSFSNFGNNSLDFVLQVHVVNVMRRSVVATDLRFAILKAFRERGVEIPYPQTDVHMRDLAWIKRAVVERMMKSAVESTAVMPDSAAHNRPAEDDAGASRRYAPRDGEFNGNGSD